MATTVLWFPGKSDSSGSTPVVDVLPPLVQAQLWPGPPPAVNVPAVIAAALVPLVIFGAAMAIAVGVTNQKHGCA